MERNTRQICRITTEPIAPDELNKFFDDPACGAVATFTGKVRNHHDGHAVASLTYEAHTTMAEKILREIAEEARGNFGIRRLIVVHRVGRLSVGETAVWIGAESPHRDAAFSACRYAIEEIKKRLPVWKKEERVDGTTHWIEGCHDII